MGEFDLSGYDDCSETFAEIDVNSEEHLQQTAYHAVATRRGTDQEIVGEEDFRNRWLHLLQFIQGKGSLVGKIRSAVMSAGRDLEDTDTRVERADYTVEEEAGGVVRWTAEITAQFGLALVSAIIAPFPQDVPPPVVPPLPPVPVDAGKTLGFLALDTNHVIGWLTGPNSGRILWTIGRTCDAAIEWLVQGIQQRFPDFAATDALPWLGRDRLVRRGFAETELAYRRRLKAWLEVIRLWGTATAVLKTIQSYFATETDPLPLCRLVQHRPLDGTRAEWISLEPDGAVEFHTETPSNWDWDSGDPFRPVSLASFDPRFWVVVYQDPDAPGPFQVVEAIPGNASLDDFVTAEENGLDLSELGNFWKSAGAWCAGIIISYDPALFDPEGTGTDYPDGTWHQYGDSLNAFEANRARPALYLEMFNHNGGMVGI